MSRFHWIIVWTLLVVVTGSSRAARMGASVPNFSLRPPLLDRLNYETTFACEGRELKVACEPGGVIRLIRGNYGRFSISLCNDHGNLDWSVNCMSYRSFLIMQDKCSQKQNCSVVVSSKIFGDPCPGTLKYLEVQYHCVSDHSSFGSKKRLNATSNSTLSNSVTSVNGTTQKPASSPPSSRNESSTGPTSSPSVPNRKPGASVTPKSSIGAMNPPPTTEPAGRYFNPEANPESKAEMGSNTVAPLVITNEENPGSPSKENSVTIEDFFCPPVLARGLMWNWTRSGEVFVQKCPGGSTGLARWECGDNPVSWTPSSPDLRDCKSVWVENLRERMMSGDSVISIASELSLMTLTKSLFSKDLYHVTDLIEQTLARAVNGMEEFLDMWRRYQVLRELLQSIVETVSKLLDKTQQDAWLDLTLLERKEIASALLDGLDESALLLAEASNQEGNYRLMRDNVLLSVQVLDVRHVDRVKFPLLTDRTSEDDDSTWVRMEDSLVLPADALADYSKNGLIKVVFVAYNGMSQLLAPETGEPQFRFHAPGEEDSRNISQIVNSRVISASIGRQRVTGLSQPVVITLRHLQEENVTNPKCVFWDFNLRKWSKDGCWVVSFNRSHTVCSCDHLTNFAVVMDVQPTPAVPSQRVLRLVSSVGCYIAAFCFLLSFLVLQIQRHLVGDHITIHKNLALCLTVAEILFAAGLDQTHLPVLCGVVAGLLHYFFLVAFIWVFLESFHIYVRLVEVFDGDKSKSVWYYGLAYGTPAVIVIIAALVDCTSYGTQHYCWLQADNYFIFSFVGPAVGILFGAAVFLCIATCILCHHTDLSTSVKGKEEARLVALRISVRWVFFLLVLFALTWSTGLVYITDEAPFVAYCFTILNALQGMYYFAFCVFGNGKLSEGCDNLLSSVMSRLRKSSSNQETTTGPTVASPGQLSLQQQSWNLPTEKSFNSLSFTTQGPPSTAAPTLGQAEQVARIIPTSGGILVEGPRVNQLWKSSGRGGAENPLGVFSNSLQKGANGTVLVNTNGTWRTINGASGKPETKRQKEHRHNHASNKNARSRSSLNSEGANGPFSEHIYESIDEDSLSPSGDSRGNTLSGADRDELTRGGPPVENYYGDHSDMSQHSSSSYGYDQRPLLITANGTLPNRTATPLYDQEALQRANYYMPDSPEMKYRPERFLYGSQRQARVAAEEASQHRAMLLAKQRQMFEDNAGDILSSDREGDLDQWEEPTLPDLLRCPNDNAVVMAILDGERVVSRLRPETGNVLSRSPLQSSPTPPSASSPTSNIQPTPLHYKLSTYC